MKEKVLKEGREGARSRVSALSRSSSEHLAREEKREIKGRGKAGQGEEKKKKNRLPSLMAMGEEKKAI